jgi:excisionase family DNA binding protein
MTEALTLPRLMSVSDAAKYLAISERTIWNLTSEQKLPAVRIGRAVRYDIGDLDAFITKAKIGEDFVK